MVGGWFASKARGMMGLYAALVEWRLCLIGDQHTDLYSSEGLLGT
jgi:hypothetical protein